MVLLCSEQTVVGVVSVEAGRPKGGSVAIRGEQRGWDRGGGIELGENRSDLEFILKRKLEDFMADCAQAWSPSTSASFGSG